MPSKNGIKPATQADIQAVRTDVQAVRTDVQAVKADVQAVRSELGAVKTELKGDIAAVRTDLERKIEENTKRLAVEIVNTNHRVDRLEESLRKEMSDNTNRILTALDQSAKTMEADHRAVILHGQALSEHGQTLKDHAKRLTTLESKS